MSAREVVGNTPKANSPELIPCSPAPIAQSQIQCLLPAQNERVCRLSGVRVARRRQRRQMLHVRAGLPRDVRVCSVLRQLGADFGFVPLVIGASSVWCGLTLLASGSQLRVVGGGMSFLAPGVQALLLFERAAPFRCSGSGAGGPC